MLKRTRLHIETLERNLGTYQKKTADLEEQLSALREEFSDTASKLAVASNESAARLNLLKITQAHLQETEAKLDAERRTNEAHRADTQELQRQLAKANDHITQLETQLRQLRKNYKTKEIKK